MLRIQRECCKQTWQRPRRDIPTDATGYKPSSIYNQVDLQQIGPRLFLVSATSIYKLRCYGILRVALIKYYQSLLSNLQRSSLVLKTCMWLFYARTYTLANFSLRNTFPLPEIMYNKTLLFSPNVFLLGLLFYNRAFAAYNLTSLEKLSRLTILLGCNKLLLRLNQILDNIPVFQKAVRTLHSQNISLNKSLSYSTLLLQIWTLGEVTGFA